MGMLEKQSLPEYDLRNLSQALNTDAGPGIEYVVDHLNYGLSESELKELKCRPTYRSKQS